MFCPVLLFMPLSFLTVSVIRDARIDVDDHPPECRTKPRFWHQVVIE